MNVAIAGAGIAGGYLARLLEQQGIVSDLYGVVDHKTTCRCRSCGWGAPVSVDRYLATVGLDLADYLIEHMEHMNFDEIVTNTPLCTIDKPGLLRDLTAGLRVHTRKLQLQDADGYDVVVDATGITRALLPPCRSELTLPTLQYRVRVDPLGSNRLEAGVYGKQLPGLGYVWVFPLAEGHYHMGVGGIGLGPHEEIMERFFRGMSGRFTFRPVCSCTGEIRVASPHYSAPFSTCRSRADGTCQLVVGVGESIGTVSPFTGEGISYSLQSAKILADCWPDEKLYASRVLDTFSWMKKERETLDYLLLKNRDNGPRLRDRWRFYCNARRSGIKLPILEAFRRMGSLSRWVEV